MNEYVAQMAPMLGIAGSFVAWLAQIPATTRGHGLLPDMALAIVGSTVAGIFASAAIFPFTEGFGMLAMFVVGACGAAAAIVTQRGVWPSR